MPQAEANIEAWNEGMAQLDEALTNKHPFAFETTLGGKTVSRKLKAACATHNVRIWYCGLHTPDQHIARNACSCTQTSAAFQGRHPVVS